MKLEQQSRGVISDQVFSLAREIINSNKPSDRCASESCDPLLVNALESIKTLSAVLDGDLESRSNKILTVGMKCLASYQGPISPEFVEMLQSMVEAAGWLNPGAVRDYSGLVREVAIKLEQHPDLSVHQKSRLTEIINLAEHELSGSAQAGLL